MKREDPTHLSHSNPSAPVSVTSQRLGHRKVKEKLMSVGKRQNKGLLQSEWVRKHKCVIVGMRHSSTNSLIVLI